MALFKPKTKEVEFFETQHSLPQFTVDTNGFILFEQRHLGGAAVIEVIPHIKTECITHEDPVYHSEIADLSENPNYEPSTNALFPDMRGQVYPGWVYFLNGLLPSGPEDEATHIQILAKKCRTREWDTRMDYACYKGHKDLDFQARMMKGQPRSTLYKAARTQDYLKLLDAMNNEIKSLSSNMFDIRKLPSYLTKFFLVISYTPSSEGWWMDGRDSDYYVSDSFSPVSLFKEDKAVDRVSGILGRFRKKEFEGNIGGQEDDFFWIESDRTAQILDTRVKKVMRVVDRWNKKDKNRPMPFHLRKMDGREVAALINMFPNIITPYWDKIWNLHANQDDVLFSIEAQRAIDTWDTSFIEGRDEFSRSIQAGTVDMRHTQQEQEDFLAKYKGVAFEDIPGLQSEYDERSWSPELEERRRIAEEERQRHADEDLQLWGDIDDSLAIADEFKTPEQRREEFLRRYKNRSAGTFVPDEDEFEDVDL